MRLTHKDAATPGTDQRAKRVNNTLQGSFYSRWCVACHQAKPVLVESFTGDALATLEEAGTSMIVKFPDVFLRQCGCSKISSKGFFSCRWKKSDA